MHVFINALEDRTDRNALHVHNRSKIRKVWGPLFINSKNCAMVLPVTHALH